MRKSLLVLVAAMSALFSAALYADDYPSRSVTIVNVFGAGGGSDTVCRIIARAGTASQRSKSKLRRFDSSAW